MPQDPAPFPADELRAAAGHDDARNEVDALHAELQSSSPDPKRIEGHVDASAAGTASSPASNAGT